MGLALLELPGCSMSADDRVSPTIWISVSMDGAVRE